MKNPFCFFSIICYFTYWKLVNSGCRIVSRTIKDAFDKSVSFKIDPIIENDNFIYGKLAVHLGKNAKWEYVTFEPEMKSTQIENLCKLMGYDKIHFIAQICFFKKGIFSLMLFSFVYFLSLSSFSLDKKVFHFKSLLRKLILYEYSFIFTFQLLF